MYLTLSWRNIWRSKRRTLIAAASVMFAVTTAVSMRSAQLGSYEYMIHSSAKLFTGYLQIQHREYWDNRSLDRSFVVTDGDLQRWETIDGVQSISPRLETYVLLSAGNITRVSLVIGIDPQREDAMTGLSGKLINGQYLNRGSNDLMIAEGLARLLKISVGDSVVIYGQGYHGVIAAARLKVAGIVKLPLPQINNRLMFISQSNAEYIFSAPGRVTSIPVMLKGVADQPRVKEMLENKTDNGLTVKTWEEMVPELKQNIQFDNASGLIMLAILYMVIAFGLLGTVMMMISERKKEFGILISVGMNKWKLITVNVMEAVMVSFIGALAGMLQAIPLVAYFHRHPIVVAGEAARAWETMGIEPIMNFSTAPSIFWHQALVVFIISLATALYPILFIRRLDPVNAVRG